MPQQEMVKLVSLEICTPYKAGEVATFDKKTAEQLLRRNMERTDFGPRYPKVKWRRYVEGQDEDLLLVNRSLTQEEHDKLLMNLHPDLVDEFGKEIEEEEEHVSEEDDPSSEVEAAVRRSRRRKQ